MLTNAAPLAVLLLPSFTGAIIAFGLNALMERGRNRRHHRLQVQEAALVYVDNCRHMNRQNIRHFRDVEQYRKIIKVGNDEQVRQSLTVHGHDLWAGVAERHLDIVTAREQAKVEAAKELRLSNLSVSFLAPALDRYRTALTGIARDPKTGVESDPNQWDRQYNACESKFLEALRVYVGTPKTPRRLKKRLGG